MARDYQKEAQDEPERLERRADELSRAARSDNGRTQVRLIVMACQARQYAANLRAMQAARLRLSYCKS